jgi:hypothetical protein
MTAFLIMCASYSEFRSRPKADRILFISYKSRGVSNIKSCLITAEDAKVAKKFLRKILEAISKTHCTVILIPPLFGGRRIHDTEASYTPGFEPPWILHSASLRSDLMFKRCKPQHCVVNLSAHKQTHNQVEACNDTQTYRSGL